jgi:hypothetical protein
MNTSQITVPPTIQYTSICTGGSDLLWHNRSKVRIRVVIRRGEDRVNDVHSVSILLSGGQEFALGWTIVVFF